MLFDDALGIFARLVAKHLGASSLDAHRFVRDVYGRLSLLLLEDVEPSKREALAAEAEEVLEAYASSAAVERFDADNWLDIELKNAAATHEKVRIGSSEASPDTAQAPDGDQAQWRRVAVVDRRIVGQDWALGHFGPIPGVPPVVTFYSIKGGVGRSTALAVAASAQAERGNNVLVVDLDLEAPGLGALLLEADGLPEFGALDWLVETNLRPDTGDALIRRCMAESPLTAGRGAVDVLPSLGRRAHDAAWNVSPKLGRAFVHPEQSGPFLKRIRRLIESACQHGLRRYDAVLVDARAGLAESSAAALIGLGAEVLCFGVDAPHTHDGYRYLFSHLAGIALPEGEIGSKTNASAQSDWRHRFRMVHAKAHASEAARRRFRDRAHDVFMEEMYEADNRDFEAADREAAEDADNAPFNFDCDDEDAPHWPWPILFDAALLDFDPRQRPEQLMREFADRAFGPFLDRLDRLIDGPAQ